MPSPQFPATATLLDAQPCLLSEFDALFAKLTQEPDAATGYFLRPHPADARVLFVFNGMPYASGRVAGIDCTLQEIHEFFADYAQQPDASLSFCTVDKRLLLGLMVLFAYRPSLTFRSDLVQIEEILDVLAEKKIDQILAFRSSESWAIAIAVKGQVAYFFPPTGTEPLSGTTAVEQCLSFFQAHQAAGIVVELYEETRVKRAGDALLITPENRGELSSVFLGAAQRAHEAEPLEATEEPPPSPPADALPVEALVVERGEADSPPPPTEDSPEMAALFRGSPPELLLFLGDKQLGIFSLSGGELKIGRSPENHIVIENSGVSRRHALVRVKDGRIVLEDLGSANGTFVRGRKIDNHMLQDGDEFVIVKHRLVYRVRKAAPAAPTVQRDFLEQTTICIDPAAVNQAAAGLAPRAEVVSAALRPRLIFPDRKRFDLEGNEVTLGSAPSCNIQIAGMFVGKVHARIVQTSEGFKIQHASGMAGTKVNGVKILEHALKHGDEIQIGKQKLLFRTER